MPSVRVEYDASPQRIILRVTRCFLPLRSRADGEPGMSSKIIFGSALALASLMLANIGSAEDASSARKGPWPIQNGHNHQPTEQELKALHLEDVTPDQAHEIDRLYDRLLGGSKVRKSIPKY
jgi:hypothetical protein